MNIVDKVLEQIYQFEISKGEKPNIVLVSLDLYKEIRQEVSLYLNYHDASNGFPLRINDIQVMRSLDVKEREIRCGNFTTNFNQA